MAWKKGQSGNPKGRPKSGNSLSDAIRRKVDPDMLIDKLLDILDGTPNDATKLRAIELLGERGWKKPAQVLEVGPADPFEGYSEEELRQLIAEDDSALGELEEAEIVEPALLEGGGVDGSGILAGASGASRPAGAALAADSRATALARGVLVRRRAAEDPDDGGGAEGTTDDEDSHT
jgi:hypothetical protein